jgi:hypothetical protein
VIEPVFLRFGKDSPEYEIGEVFAVDYPGAVIALSELLAEAATELDRLRSAVTVLDKVSAADIMEYLSDHGRRRN